MRTVVAVVIIVLAGALPARAQFRNHVDVDRVNRRLAGCVLDFTHNSGVDKRIFSPILGQSRDLYVYLPPGFTRAKAYPLVLYLHTAYVDEHIFIGSDRLLELDRMMQSGEFPPTIFAAPDGTIDGRNHISSPHSLYLNGRFGRFEDYLLQELVPFLMANYSIRPEPEAHAILGVSAGGLAGASVALRYPHLFGAVATIGAPLNLRYTTCSGNSREDFNPATYRWKNDYDPEEVVGTFYAGLSRVPARKYIAPVFGDDVNAVPTKIMAINPADLLFTANPAPGRPAMYVHFAGRDNWNFDAQAESFIWLAQGRGLPVDVDRTPHGRHNLPYLSRSHDPAFDWLARHLPPPFDLAPR